MAAYAVIARIGRADPHLKLGDLDLDLNRDPEGPNPGLASDSPTIILDQPDGPSFDERLGDHVARLGEAFGQMTFYLFDPESWRR
jgi:hypothetical protein